MALPKREVLRYYRKLSAIDYELFQSDFLSTISSEPLTTEFLDNSLISILKGIIILVPLKFKFKIIKFIRNLRKMHIFTRLYDQI